MPGIDKEYNIKARDFLHAGEGSIQIKKYLKSIGLESDLIRRIAVCAYESEMNVVMHGGAGIMHLIMNDDKIIIEVKDDGPGIGDINLALMEGYSTAQEEYRQMGFGAGMGLPNIVKNSDSLEISSNEGEGTCLIISFFIIQG